MELNSRRGGGSARLLKCPHHQSHAKCPYHQSHARRKRLTAGTNSRLTVDVPWIIVPASKPSSSLIPPSSSSSSIPSPASRPTSSSAAGASPVRNGRGGTVGSQGDGAIVAVGSGTAVLGSFLLLAWSGRRHNPCGTRQTQAAVARALRVVHPARTPVKQRRFF